MNWQKLNTYAINTPNGVENIYFERSDDKQNFRIVNEYGNSKFEFDFMTGYEMISRIQSDFNTIVNDELQTYFKNNQNSASYPDAAITNEHVDCQGDIPGV
jgi:hypothetical protein